MEDTTNCMRISIPPVGAIGPFANHEPRIFKRCAYIVARITPNLNVVEYSRHTWFIDALQARKLYCRAYIFKLCYDGSAPYIGASNNAHILKD